METNSLIKTIFSVIGFMVVASVLMSILGGLLGFAIHILLPMALVIWLVRFIFGNNRQNRRYYR